MTTRKPRASMLAGATVALGLSLVLATDAGASVIDPRGAGVPGLQDGLATRSDWVLDPAVRAQAAVAALARELRARGDYHTILAAAPRLSELLPADRTLAHLRALALAVTGETTSARAALAEFPPSGDTPLGWMAEALLARNAGALEAAQEALDLALAADPDHAYGWNIAGTLAVLRDDPADAAARFARAAALAPEGAVYAANLGAALVLQGDLAAAEAALDRAVALAPAGCEALRTRAALRRLIGAHAAAVDDLERCLAADPRDAEAARALVEGLESQRRHAEAARAAGAHRVVLPEADLLRARLALKAGDVADARAVLEGMRGPDAAALRALLLSADGHFAAAAEAAATAAATASDSAAPAWLHFGLAAAAGQGAAPPAASLPDRPDPDPAADWLAALRAAGAGDTGALRALAPQLQILPGLSLLGLPPAQIERLATGPAAPWLAAATTQQLLGFDTLARRAAEQATAADPELALGFVQLALAATAEGDRPTAITALDRALALAPASFAASVAMAESLVAIGAFDRALGHYQTAVSIHETPSLVIRIGLVAEQLARDDLAEAAYDRFIALEPESFIGYNQLAWHLAERERDLDRALDLARSADRLHPGNASILDTLGWILHLQGDNVAAAEALRQAHAVAGQANPMIVEHLATVEAALGNTATAERLRAALGGGALRNQ
ncbi:MAG: hypothetical protein ACXIU8_07200 [Alkalilacustris sp.]